VESTNQILRAGRHLLSLIDEVLDISRIASGHLSISLEPVSVTEVIRETVELIRPLAADRGVTVQAEEANGLHVLADRQRLKQVLLNLLSNAVKFNRDEGFVRLSWEKGDEGSLRIDVRDTGQGIAPDKIERVFAPFDRLGAEGSGVEGTGLGLSLVKGLIEAMGGTIDVESEPGVGSTFRVELPLAEPPLHRLERQHVPTESNGDDAGARTILYIEDNLSNLKLIQRVAEGYRA
jgi:signal transduction histidine kinase